MSKREKEAFADDGRTVADMSGVSRRNLFGFDPNSLRSAAAAERARPSEPVRAAEDDGLSRKERLWAILGALKAILLVGLCFAVGMALVILAFQYL